MSERPFNPHDVSQYLKFESEVQAPEEQLVDVAELRAAALQAERDQRNNPRSYGNYWRATQQQNQEVNPALANTCRNNQRRLERAQREMLKPDASLDEASEWYLRLGSLSRLEGAEEMLVYAANLPIEARADEYTPDVQRLYSGCMLMEASLINERSVGADAVRQEQYENLARERFERVAQKAPDSKEGYLAQVYLTDLDFRKAGHLFAKAKASGDDERMADARKLAIDAQDNLGALLEGANTTLKSARGEEYGEFRGRVVETCVLFLLRERYLHAGEGSRGTYDTHFPHQAFPREDWPKDSMVFNHQKRLSYDVGIVLKSPRGVGIIPIQVKGSKAAKDYDPRIVMMVDAENKSDEIVQAVARHRGKIPGSAVKVKDLAIGMERALVARLNEKRAAREKAARG